ncbi:5-oxoprolinase subunit B family protein [Dietzia cercidiphylli]|uniref:5-oxoprolinase subunit B family protein n=1 Tax=Dietzia cercidiphylli TaxID=498199 RepID=UPI00223A7850|nr:allophanate hydrolase subunit 1 [Dietzia cercidiphylli]MCT1516814.1 allophanate hydrolase subunit 1 [Dietzia cercidiphylli]
MTTTRIRRCGEAALLLDCADLAEAVELAGLVGRLHPEAVDVVAGARTVLVTARDASALPALRRGLEELLAGDPRAEQPQAEYPGAEQPQAERPGAGRAGVERAGVAGSDVEVREVVLDVRYDGPDLADVADLVGVSTETFVRQHTSITWRAAFGGFAPGFFYLVDERELIDDGPELRGHGGVAEPLPSVPRLGSPRPRVPAGSVGMADRFCAVYPGASPGGWRLIGTTDALLWDSDRPDPALLAPGDRVRFRAAGPRDVPR